AFIHQDRDANRQRRQVRRLRGRHFQSRAEQVLQRGPQIVLLMDLKQPVGPPVDPTPAQPPAPVTLTGRFGSVAQLDPARDAADLWRAFKGHNDIWTYISRHGPFADEPSFAAWLAERATSSDPYTYTVRDQDVRARGLVSFLEIRPAARVIEVGFIVLSPTV